MAHVTGPVWEYITEPAHIVKRDERFQEVLGRIPTRAEFEWMCKGWIPGSLL